MRRSRPRIGYLNSGRSCKISVSIKKGECTFSPKAFGGVRKTNGTSHHIAGPGTSTGVRKDHLIIISLPRKNSRYDTTGPSSKSTTCLKFCLCRLICPVQSVSTNPSLAQADYILFMHLNAGRQYAVSYSCSTFCPDQTPTPEYANC